VEVVVRRVVVELESVGALRERPAVELLAVRIPEMDVLGIADVGGQDWKGELRDAELAGRVGLPDPEDVVA
jgi:hypothetical protein